MIYYKNPYRHLWEEYINFWFQKSHGIQLEFFLQKNSFIWLEFHLRPHQYTCDGSGFHGRDAIQREAEHFQGFAAELEWPRAKSRPQVAGVARKLLQLLEAVQKTGGEGGDGVSICFKWEKRISPSCCHGFLSPIQTSFDPWNCGTSFLIALWRFFVVFASTLPEWNFNEVENNHCTFLPRCGHRHSHQIRPRVILNWRTPTSWAMKSFWCGHTYWEKGVEELRTAS